MRRSLLVLTAALAVCTGCRDNPHAVRWPFVRTQPVSANQLMAAVNRTYASAPSYADEGVVITTFHSDHLFTSRKPFTTQFSRGGPFRYEFRDRFLYASTHFVVWTERGAVDSWWTVIPRIERFRTIADALDGPSGVSGGSAHTIPTLLLGNAGRGWRITNLRNAVIVGEQSLPPYGRCFVVQGTHPRQARMFRIWIDQRSLAILRIYDRSRLDSTTEVEETTIYKPRFDVAIDVSKIHFTPPRQLTLPGGCGIDLPKWLSWLAA